ncbi:MAG: hypothetical protein AAF963_02350 [Bacteroidota bacterium]
MLNNKVMTPTNTRRRLPVLALSILLALPAACMNERPLGFGGGPKSSSKRANSEGTRTSTNRSAKSAGSSRMRTRLTRKLKRSNNATDAPYTFPQTKHLEIVDVHLIMKKVKSKDLEDVCKEKLYTPTVQFKIKNQTHLGDRKRQTLNLEPIKLVCNLSAGSKEDNTKSEGQNVSLPSELKPGKSRSFTWVRDSNQKMTKKQWEGYVNARGGVVNVKLKLISKDLQEKKDRNGDPEIDSKTGQSVKEYKLVNNYQVEYSLDSWQWGKKNLLQQTSTRLKSKRRPKSIDFQAIQDWFNSDR